jgi:hypothetical protein
MGGKLISPPKQPLYTIRKAALILGLSDSCLKGYVWTYGFIKPVALKPCRFDFDQLVALRRISDMLRCGVPRTNVVALIMRPEVSIGVGSCLIQNTIRMAEATVEEGLRRYRRMVA